MAEAMLRARAGSRGLSIVATSRGLALVDREATKEAVAAAARHGADARHHRSAILDREAVATADLILGMERRHVREAVVLHRDALRHAFTLKELVRRGDGIGPRRAGEDLAEWLGRAGPGRRAADLLGDAADDEVADPFRRPMADYERCADEIADLLDRLLELAWPPEQAEGAA
jgi:protein-tyrosine phosphatase